MSIVLGAALVGLIPLLLLLLSLITAQTPSHLPPGKSRWPLLGDTLALARFLRNNKLHVFLEAKTQMYGPVFKISLLGKSTVVLPSPEGVKFIYKNEYEMFDGDVPTVKTILGKYTMSMLHPQLHSQTKSLVIASVHSEALQGMMKQVSRVAMANIEEFWVDNSIIQAHNLAKLYASQLFMRMFLGIPSDTITEIQGLFQEIDALVKGLLRPPLISSFWKAKAARKKINSMIDNLMERHKVVQDTQLVSGLVTIAKENGMPDGEDFIRDTVSGLLVGGRDTTGSIISMAIKHLAEDPDCMEKVLQEQASIRNSKGKDLELTWNDLKNMNYTWQVVQEIIRMYTRSGIHVRKAKIDFQYKGYTIPKGWLVLAAIDPGNDQDERHIFKPSRFDKCNTERECNIMRMFGGGIRACPGFQLAKTSVLVFIHYFVLKFNWTLADPHEKIETLPVPLPLKGMPVKIFSRN